MPEIMETAAAPADDELFIPGQPIGDDTAYRQLVLDLAAEKPVTHSRVSGVLLTSGRSLAQLESDRRKAVRRRELVEKLAEITPPLLNLEKQRLATLQQTMAEQEEAHQRAMAALQSEAATLGGRIQEAEITFRRDHDEAIRELQNGVSERVRSDFDSIQKRHTELQGQRFHALRRYWDLEPQEMESELRKLEYEVANYPGAPVDPYVTTRQQKIGNLKDRLQLTGRILEEADAILEQQRVVMVEHRQALERLYAWQSFDVSETKQ